MKNSYWLFLPIIIIYLFFNNCREEHKDWVVRINEFSVSPEKFLQKYKRTFKYQNQTSFTVQDLKEFADRSFVKELLFIVEGYSLGLDQEDEIRETIEKRKLMILEQKDGPLFKNIIPQNSSAHETEVKMNEYMKTILDKYVFQITPQGAKLFLQICATPQERIRAQVLNSEAVPFVRFKDKTLNVKEVIQHHSSEFLNKREKIVEHSDVEHYIVEWFKPELYMLEMIDLGLDKDPTVTEELIQSERNIIIRECEKRLVGNKIRITGDEVNEHYDNEKEKWNSVSEKVAKQEIGIKILMEKRKQALNNTVKELAKKYKIEFNDSLFEDLSETLTIEKSSKVE